MSESNNKKVERKKSFTADIIVVVGYSHMSDEQIVKRVESHPDEAPVAQVFLQYRLQKRLVGWTVGLVLGTWVLAVGTILFTALN